MIAVRRGPSSITWFVGGRSYTSYTGYVSAGICLTGSVVLVGICTLLSAILSLSVLMAIFQVNLG